MTKTRVHTWDDWSAGDHGIIASIRAPRNSYSGRNAVVYGSGTIGPRCGIGFLAEATDPGEVRSVGFFNAKRGTFSGTLGWFGDVAWYVSGDTVYQVTTNDAPNPTAYTSPLEEVPVGPVAGVPVGSDYVYLTHGNDQPVVRIFRNGGDLEEATDAPDGCRFIVLYGERLLAAASDGIGLNRVLYSDPISGTSIAEFDVALNFFDVGPPGSIIVGMWVLRTVVYFALADGSWWIYTGVPGVSDSLRLAHSGGGAAAPAAGTVMGTNSVWFIGREQHFPSYFNGSSIHSIGEQDTVNGIYGQPVTESPDPYCTVLALSRRGDLLILPGPAVGEAQRTALLLWEERWSRHDLPAIIGAALPDGSGRVLLCDGGSTSAAAKFYTWRATGWDRPPDGSAAIFGRDTTDSGITIPVRIDLPEFVPGNGGEITVRYVLLDLLVYETPTSPSLRVTVTPTRLYPGSEPTELRKTLTVPDGVGSSDGDPVRLRLDLGQQASGSGVSIRLDYLRGVAVDRVHLVGHEMEPRAA